MNLPLQAVMQTFCIEARERIAELEAGLLTLEQAPSDTEALSAVFRAAHTIKGSAGMLGLDAVSAFTHGFEDVLDALRTGARRFEHRLGELLLLAADHLALLLDAAEAGEVPDAALQAAGTALLQALHEEPQASAVPALPPPLAPAPMPVERERPAAETGGPEFWHLSVRFGPDALRNGFDPLGCLRYLHTLGRVLRVVTLTDALPDWAGFDAETCFLGFEIDLDSSHERETIAATFEFVADDCTLHILPPNSQAAQYLDLIRALPEDDLSIGEILVRSGCLSRLELEQGLRAQAQAAAGSKRLGELLVDRHCVDADVVRAALERQAHGRTRRTAEAHTLRVQAPRLDELIERIGELVTVEAGATLLARELGLPALDELATTLNRLVSGIRDNALQLRMVPIGETFARFPRVVRDLGQELGKDIDLELCGEDTELDKAIVEPLVDPLMHLVRNAVDHGIEPLAVRRARGKPGVGRVRLSARHEGANMLIEVADDGGGLDGERIRSKAVAAGLIGAGEHLDAQGLARLIFAPGLSTRDTVTDVSGRGVGLEVVQRNIEALRGSIEIESEAGAGTTVRLRLPLTLAIIDGFLIRCAGTSFVLPLDQVEECLDFDVAALHAPPRQLDLRGRPLPLIRLHEFFGLGTPCGRRASVVVVRCGERRAGLLVDELLGEFQTVIKPLGPLFEHLRALGGTTILGSGEVALIVDVPALFALAAARTPPAPVLATPSLPACA